MTAFRGAAGAGARANDNGLVQRGTPSGILQTMVNRFFKRNGILLVTFCVYLAAVIGLVVMIDAMVYQVKKREIIQSKYQLGINELFPETYEELLVHGERWRLELSAGGPESEGLERLTDHARKILDGPSSIYRIFVQNAQDKVLFDEEVSKFREFNNFSNSLWLRRFTAVRGLPLTDPAPSRRDVELGTLWIHFTTPWHLPPDARSELATLTQWFRLLTLGIVGVLTLLTILFAKTILIPMRNVTLSIEASSDDRTRFIKRPSSHLENLYNGMARDAVIARLQEHLAERINEGSPLTNWELIESAGANLVKQHTGAKILCVEFAEEGPGRLRWTNRYCVKRAGREQSETEEEALAGALADYLGAKERSMPEGGPSRSSDKKPHLLKPFGATRLIDDPERPGIHYGYALSIGGGRRPDQVQAAERLLEGFAAAVGREFGALLSRNQSLERERGRASINLSRSLGHDLTNIIATSKLDLMALETLLGNGAPPLEGERREILTQSLRGLIDSTRFLQEVVNLYRAYAFLKQPVLETHDANVLIAETVRLFRLSTSQRTKFEQHLDAGAPRCRVDPRLIKLALFNLFANSVEAIRHAEESGDGDHPGTITIATGRSDEAGLIIRIQDNGTGILDDEGKPAEAEEIEEIFSLGFSRKTEDEGGEGLGLNWVRSIVQEIHGGTIRAENLPEGGACFSMSFPPLDYHSAPQAESTEATQPAQTEAGRSLSSDSIKG